MKRREGPALTHIRRIMLLRFLKNIGRLTTTDYLARVFEVCERTIYRDIEELQARGHRIEGCRGPGGGFMWRPQRTPQGERAHGG